MFATLTLALCLLQDGDRRDPAQEIERAAGQVLGRVLSDRRIQRGIEQAWERIPDECKQRAVRDAIDGYTRLPAQCRQRVFRFTMENLRHLPTAMRGTLQQEMMRAMMGGLLRRPAPTPAPAPPAPSPSAPPRRRAV